MPLMLFLGSVTVRSFCFTVGALALLRLFRVKHAAVQHAVLTIITAGTLLLAALTPLMRPAPLQVLLPRIVEQQTGKIERTLRFPLSPPADELPVGEARFNWGNLAAGVYLAGTAALLSRLALGYLGVRRLAGSSRPAGGVWESDWIAAPVVLGWLRPRILLPAGWEEWAPGKLAAVLAHERMHIRRKDSAIALMAAVNRCLFWYNPLAWWLERRLAILAEQACDDAVLLQMGDRDVYALTLLDVAAAVQNAGGRLHRGALAMAKPGEVRNRIERILDEEREIPQYISGRRWAALGACGFVAVCLAAALQPVAAQGMQWSHAPLPLEEVKRLENDVARNPEDTGARTKLIAHYLAVGANEQRAKHVLWMIERHPEAEVHEMMTLFGTPGPLQDVPSYERAAALWREEAARRANDRRAVLHAARFFDMYYLTYVKDPWQGEQWLKRARDMEPRNPMWTSRLLLYYTGSLWAVARGGGPLANPGFAEHARAELERSTNGALLWQAGQTLTRSEPVENQSQMELAEFGRRLLQRGGIGFPPAGGMAES